MKKFIYLMIILCASISLIGCQDEKDTQTITIEFVTNNQEIIESKTVEKNTSVTLPILETSGYNFIGWFDNKNVEYNNDSIINENIILYAKWEIKKFNVIFVDFNDQEIVTIEVNYGMDITNPPIPERNGYEFIGWDKELTNITSDLTIKALYEEVNPGLVFNLIDNGYEITEYTGTDENVKIPSQYQGLSVLSIGEKAFYDNWNIKSVTLPDSIIKISNQAFYGCYSMEEINIPSSVTEIGEEAFFNCTSISNIEISSKVIGDSAFYNCTNLVNITINEGVETIGSWAFQSCSNLTQIYIPSTVSFIGKNAFSWCRKLNTISTPANNYEHLNSLLTTAGNIYTNFTVVGIE